MDSQRQQATIVDLTAESSGSDEDVTGFPHEDLVRKWRVRKQPETPTSALDNFKRPAIPSHVNTPDLAPQEKNSIKPDVNSHVTKDVPRDRAEPTPYMNGQALPEGSYYHAPPPTSKSPLRFLQPNSVSHNNVPNGQAKAKSPPCKPITPTSGSSSSIQPHIQSFPHLNNGQIGIKRTSSGQVKQQIAHPAVIPHQIINQTLNNSTEDRINEQRNQAATTPASYKSPLVSEPSIRAPSGIDPAAANGVQYASDHPSAASSFPADGRHAIQSPQIAQHPPALAHQNGATDLLGRSSPTNSTNTPQSVPLAVNSGPTRVDAAVASRSQTYNAPPPNVLSAAMIHNLNYGQSQSGQAGLRALKPASKLPMPRKQQVAVSSVSANRDALDTGVGLFERETFTNRATRSRETAVTKRLLDGYQRASADFAFGKGYSREEDQLIVHLKEDLNLGWSDIYVYFPHRTAWNVLQTRYSRKLKGTVLSSQFEILPHVPTVASKLRHSTRVKENDTGRYAISFPPIESDEESIGSDGHPDMGPSKSIARSSLNSPKEPSLDAIEFAHRRVHQKRQRQDDLWQARVRDNAALASLTPKLSRSRSRGPRPQKRASFHIQRPYLSLRERKFLHDSFEEGLWDSDESLRWEGVNLHVDFNETELAILEPSILKIRPAIELIHDSMTSTSGRKSRLTAMMHGAPFSDTKRISWLAQTQGECLHRNRDSIEAFLVDLASGDASSANHHPTAIRLTIKQCPDRKRNTESNGSYLRTRELGTRPLKKAHLNDMGPLLSFTGTSSDVNTLAWSSQSSTFAVGAFALTDRQSMQYNRPNNLLLGDVSGTLIELPDHSTPRPDTSLSQDPLLFSSISAVHFSPVDNHIMISAGYDNHVRVWDVGTTTSRLSRPRCRWDIPFSAPLDVLAVNNSGLFAAGAKQRENSVRVFRYGLELSREELKFRKFSSKQAQEKPESEIYPSCLRWGYERYLLAGFCGSPHERKGETLLCDVETNEIYPVNKQHAFDVAWSPSVFGRFAVACAAGGKDYNRGTKSVVRIYDSKSLSSSSFRANAQRTFELECPAFDMNDVIFNPFDDNLLSVGTTDGTTYMWDMRKPDHILQRLVHGDPLHELGDAVREEADTGVRFISWGQDRQLYTGSSDGVVACWNPYYSPEDAHQRDVLQMNSGIMAGAFSPDHTHLLLGDVEGSVVLLGPGQGDVALSECDKFKLTGVDRGARSHRAKDALSMVDGSEAHAAVELLDTQQIELRPFGDLPIRQAVQGPNYNGPFNYDRDAPELRENAAHFQARAKIAEASDENATVNRAALVQHEDINDSQLWQHRIPFEIRQSENLEFSTMQDIDLSCSQCQTSRLVKTASRVRGSSDDVFSCPKCKGVWRLDVLGFTPIGGSSVREVSKDYIAEVSEPASKAFKSKAGEDRHAGLWEIDEARLRWLNI